MESLAALMIKLCWINLLCCCYDKVILYMHENKQYSIRYWPAFKKICRIVYCVRFICLQWLLKKIEQLSNTGSPISLPPLF